MIERKKVVFWRTVSIARIQLIIMKSLIVSPVHWMPEILIQQGIRNVSAIWRLQYAGCLD